MTDVATFVSSLRIRTTGFEGKVAIGHRGSAAIHDPVGRARLPPAASRNNAGLSSATWARSPSATEAEERQLNLAAADQR